jgi:hypothetical protein
MTVDEFLDWEDGTDTRYELIGGVVLAMAPPAPAHGRLSANLIVCGPAAPAPPTQRRALFDRTGTTPAMSPILRLPASRHEPRIG